MALEIQHGDHGIAPEQWAYIEGELEKDPPTSFFIREIQLPAEVGQAVCGIHGPSMGDAPVSREEVTTELRGEPGTPNRWPDPIVERPSRRVPYVQVIGNITPEGGLVIYTCYGGPLAPRNPLDPNQDEASAKAAAEFWAVHALSRPGL